MKLVPLRHLSAVPIANGLGLAGSHTERSWPRYIRTTDIAGPKSLRSDVFVSQPPDVAKAAMLERGDLLMTAAGASIGKSVLFIEESPACYAGFLVRVRPFSNEAGRFLSYWMQSKHYWDQIAIGAVKATIENFSASRYRALLVPQPSLAEQRAISNFLDCETARIDLLIHEQLRLIELLRERRALAIFYATTRGIDKSSELRDTGISWVGAAPSHWEATTLRRLGSLHTGTTPKADLDELLDPQGPLPWAKPEDLGRNTNPRARLDARAGAELSVLCNAVLVCCIGATVGKVGFAAGDCASNQQITAIATNDEPVFWFYALSAAAGELRSLAVGNTMPILNNQRLGALEVVRPPLVEQRRIAAYLDNQTARIDSLIGEAEKVIELSSERRSALITAAVTGQIDVRSGVA